MTNENQSKNKLRGKLFHREHDLDKKYLPHREAHVIERDSKGAPTKFKIVNKKKNEETIVIPGEEVDQAGTASIDKSGDLQIGSYKIVVGENILSEYKSKPAGKPEIINDTSVYSQFFIKHLDGKWQPHNVGDEVEGLGKSSLDEYQNLCFGEAGSIKAYPWIQETSLVVLEKTRNRGYDAFFNVRLPEDGIGENNGFRGVLYPSEDGVRPTVFSEQREYRDNQGRTVNKYFKTGAFWPSEDRKYCTAKVRKPADAIAEAEANENINIAKTIKQAARQIRFDPKILLGIVRNLIGDTNIFIYSRYQLKEDIAEIVKSVTEKRRLAQEEEIELSDREIAEMITPNIDSFIPEEPSIDATIASFAAKRKLINDESWSNRILFTAMNGELLFHFNPKLLRK